jgi:hypothetical protein
LNLVTGHYRSLADNIIPAQSEPIHVASAALHCRLEPQHATIKNTARRKHPNCRTRTIPDQIYFLVFKKKTKRNSLIAFKSTDLNQRINSVLASAKHFTLTSNGFPLIATRSTQ